MLASLQAERWRRVLCTNVLVAVRSRGHSTRPRGGLSECAQPERREYVFQHSQKSRETRRPSVRDGLGAERGSRAVSGIAADRRCDSRPVGVCTNRLLPRASPAENPSTAEGVREREADGIKHLTPVSICLDIIHSLDVLG